HRGHWISLIAEREHNGQHHPSIDKSGELGPTRLSTADSRHGMHHSIRDAPRGASAVALLPGFPAGHRVSTKATGGEVSVVGVNNGIAGEFPAHPLPGCLQIIADTDTDIAGDVDVR